MENKTNGRVDILSLDTNILFSMKDRISVESQPDFRGAMTGNWYDTALSDAFFSSKNIQIIQNGIRAGVYEMSNKQYVIGEQNPNELKIIMRSIFLQYSRNLSNNIKEQIASLNSLVLDYAVRQVYGEAVGYMKYKYDSSTMYEPISRPVMSKTNDKQLLLKKWF